MVTWGSIGRGGESGDTVQSQLRHVWQIKSNPHVFAAILSDETVVTWGYESFGGDSSQVQAELHDVKQIQAPEP